MTLIKSIKQTYKGNVLTICVYIYICVIKFYVANEIA